MKRKLKSALSLLLCMIMVFGAVAVGGEGIGAILDGMKANAYSIFTHEVINGKVKIVRCDTAASGAVTVPASIDGMVVCHPAYFIEMLSGLFVNFSMRLLIFSSHRRIISIEK